MIDLYDKINTSSFFDGSSDFVMDYIVTNTIGEDFPLMLQNHLNCEICICFDGEAIAGTDGNKTIIKKGSLMLVNPYANHGFSSSTKASFYIIGFSNIQFDIPGTDVLIKTVDITLMMDIIEQMKKFASDPKYKSTNIVCNLAKVLLEIAHVETSTNRSKYIAGRGSFLTNKVADYIDKNFKADISLESLSKMFNCSKSTLAHSFKNDYGVSVMNYLKNRRLKEILFWLEISDRSVSDLAMDHKFDTMPYFYKYFERKMGMTPKEYRQMKRLENKEKRINSANEIN